jgi:hypothetical protein
MTTRPSRALLRAFALLGTGLASQASAANLCQNMPSDKSPRTVASLAKPALGQAVIDPRFGGSIRRITAATSIGGRDAAIVPIYSTISAWNADESLLLLYRVGRGHELYNGRTYAFVRALDIAPNDVEQIYWHVTDPNVLLYVSGKSLMRYRVATGAKETIKTFSTCTTNLTTGDDPMFTSWDSNVIGLKCGSSAFIYRISTGTTTGTMSTAGDPPKVAPSGQRALVEGYVVNLGLQVQRRLDLSNPWDHGSLGRLANGRDVWNAVAFDPGPLGSGVGSLVSYDLQDGTSKVVVGPATGWPYPPTGSHVSSLANQAPGWVFLSMAGAAAGSTALHGEIALAEVASGKVCRLAHHRSRGNENTRLQQPYWAEPRVTPSPTGTRAVFGSDWGGGASVDTYVIELPADLGLGVGVTIPQSTYRTGNVLRPSLQAVNAGRNTTVDIIAFQLAPNGNTAKVVTATGTTKAGQLSSPSTLTGFRTALNLAAPFQLNVPVAPYTFTAADPRGTYYWIVAAVRPGSLSDNVFNPGDILSVGAAGFVLN